MKNLKKKALMAGSLVAAAAIAVGGTLAYANLSYDDEDALNTYTVGDAVDIVINEYQRENGADSALEDFEQGKELYPIVGSAQATPNSDNMDKWGMPEAENYGDKIVTVKNTGKADAKIRVFVAKPMALADLAKDGNDSTTDDPLHTNLGNRVKLDGDKEAYTDAWGDAWKTNWGWSYDYNNKDELFVAEINGEQYEVATYYYNVPLAPGKETTAVMAGAYLDSRVDYDNGIWTMGDYIINYDLSQGVHIPVYAEAIAANSNGEYIFEETAKEAFSRWATSVKTPTVVESIDDVMTLAKAGGSVVLTDDVKTAENILQNGGTLSGGGNVIDGESNKTVGRSDCVISTTGGTIEDITVSGGFRGIGAGSSGAYKMTENLYLDNVTITGTTYGINIGLGNGYWLYAEDSTICDWNSYGGLGGAQFTNCTFTSEGSYYAMQRISENATFTYTNCKFEQNTYDGRTEKYMLESYGNGTIVLENCYMDGVLITEDNVNDLFAIDNVTVIVK